MSSRVFQSVIVQMKEATDRMIGVIDADSTVISCSDTSRIGEKWPEAVIKLNSAPDSIVVVDKKTFKPLVSWSAYFDYAVFAEGDDEIAKSLCVMAYVALNGAKTYYEEKHDKGTFVKNIITDNILPLLIFVAIGYFMDRRFRLDVSSLTKLTFYIILPCFIFYSIYVAKIDFSLFHVFIISLVLMAMLGVIGTLIAKARNWDAGKREAFKNGTMFSNAGNIGIALIALVFSNAPYVTESGTPYLAEAAAVSTLVLVQMNMFLNTLGLYQAGKGSLSPHDALRVVLHMPVIYTLTAAFAVKSIGIDLSGTFIWPILQNCAAALVAVVMMALGMQIHRSKISFSDPDAWLACFVRLLIGPFCAWFLIRLWALAGCPFSQVASQTILIMSAVPSPVNSVLYAVEFHNHENFATEIVMMTTFLSCITMTSVIYMARILFPL